jgi:pimeloyl-ACP methyl ester carboxylesterase
LLGGSAVVTEPTDLEWTEVANIGSVFRVSGGPALLVSPMALSPEMRRIMPALIAFDARPWLARLSVPALVICGTEDPVVPIAHARTLHQAIAGSELVEIAGAGHVPTAARHPEVAAAVGRFLAGLQ